MKKLYIMRSFAILVAALFAVSTFAQSKAKIQIKKNENGVITEETREVPITEGQDIETILKEMGVLDEFGKLRDGQSFQISISKNDTEDGFQNLDLDFAPVPPMDPMAPMPPMTWEMEMGGRAFLGVMLKETIENRNGEETISGAIISEVIPGTAAEEAGLMAGDIIKEIDNQEIATVGDAIEYIRSKEVGDKVKIEVERNGKMEKVNAKLGEKEMEEGMFFRGPGMEGLREMEMLENLGNMEFKFDGDSIMIFCPSSPNCVCPNDSMKICQPFSWNEEGFEMKETSFLGVTPNEDIEVPGVPVNIVVGSAAEKMGLQNGDIITDFNGVKVETFNDLADQIEVTAPASIVNIAYKRNNSTQNASGEIGTREISSCEDIRIFRDFKGMDEGGNYFFDYEFDMNEEDIEEHMESLLDLLGDQQDQLEAEQQRIMAELDEYRSSRSTMNITIEIESITPEEAELLNQKATPKLELKNDLEMTSISFFPNPNDGIINLNFNLPQAGDLQVVMFDTAGNKVFVEERSNFSGAYSNTIDISEHADGTYYMQIMQNGKSYSKKIVKGE